MRDMTQAEIEKNITNRLIETLASLEALQAVKINTKHTKLTNRAIENGIIRDYLSIGKALAFSYQVEYVDGSRRYMTDELPAYSYEDENGQELGTDGYIRISRTITPSELAKLVGELIETKEEYIALLQKEYKQAKTIASERKAITEQIEAFNKKVSYASDARLAIR